jgi:hypothetical protein
MEATHADEECAIVRTHQKSDSQVKAIQTVQNQQCQVQQRCNLRIIAPKMSTVNDTKCSNAAILIHTLVVVE